MGWYSEDDFNTKLAKLRLGNKVILAKV